MEKTAKKSASKPNIVFLLIDDLGWKDTGFMGSEYYETPCMDRLASEGTVFTNAYANSPNCAPSRASLMSGKYCPRHGIYTVDSPERGQPHLRKLIPAPNRRELGVEHKTIAEFLKEAGYVCGHVGKWHLGEGPETGPEGRGFVFNAGGIHKGHPPAGYFSPYQIATLADGPEKEYLTDRLTDEAIHFMEQYRDEPFFLHFAHYAVHTPLQAKEELIHKYENRQPSEGQDNPVYAAMIESTDQSVGRLMDKLEELGLRENTIVVLFSDNGGVGGYRELGIQGKNITSQAPLKGGKGMMYEGGIRVPMVVRWPGVSQAGAVCDIPVTGVDFLPTFLEAAGLKKSPTDVLDGESLIPLLRQDGAWTREHLFWHFPAYLEGGKTTWRTTPASALRSGEWKLIESFEDGELELYRLSDDIGETANLASQYPQIAAELHEVLKAWRADIQAPVPTRPNPLYGGVHAESRKWNDRVEESRKGGSVI